ncbi:sulfotransferase family protein [Nocardioides coralli]|uniref:sulfotransferase family protein n=1 Tax=Nocardioides coralli TaxID=2872154 RepID=UPI001CA3C7EF|nr:sulfotransferase [Nocardioides coralli]QZY30224.1 sulfotransferase domain-containing protein [Nocardioides coralli]
MPLPTFVIAGAQKCGTTSLSEALRKHREIHISRPKELHFFDRRYRRGLEWYESQFTPRPHHRQVGEATPAYMYDPVARERLGATLPEARILVILRNPVDRAYSHYWHKRRLGDETLETFEEAIEAEPERRARDQVKKRIGFAYVDRGHYASQVEALFANHGRERVHVLLLDDVSRDQVGTMRAVLEFLGVDPQPAEHLEFPRSNKYRVVDESGAQAAAAYTPMSPETRARLTEHYTESNERLAELIGRDLSSWLKP